MGGIDSDLGPVSVNGKVRPMLLALGAAALVPLPAAPSLAREALASSAPADHLQGEITRRAGPDVREFYAARGNRPLWLTADGRISPAAGILLGQLDSARLDGLKPGKLKLRNVEKALDRAGSGSPEMLARAELALSNSYVRYVRALRDARRGDMIYESEALAPVVPTARAALEAAASGQSLAAHVEAMGWMHPLYAPMREALARPGHDEGQRRRIAMNLERIRALPAHPEGRHVLVDTAGARLMMYRDGKVVDTMRVVVGRPDQQTPNMAGFLRFAIVNPYWNVPEDLVQTRIAANVVDKGIAYLKNGGYQVLSDWSADATLADPRRIDWHAVTQGTRESPRVRQLPGKGNFMGKVKFMFPNELGIYLHDTPDKHLLKRDGRQFSSGCVRLEDADRFGRWLLDKPLPARPRAPEQRVELPEVVPIYITYLTAMPDKSGIAFRDDVYTLDTPEGRRRGGSRLARADRP